MALSVYTGTYVGNGGTTGTRAITGVGFQPKFIIVWNDGADNTRAQFGISSYSTAHIGFLGENGWFTDTNYDLFQSYDSDGFTIKKGSNAAAGYHLLNINGVNYYYLAIGGTDCYAGSYTGNGSDNRSLTGVGFQPLWILTMGGNQHSAMKGNNSGASTDQFQFTYNAADTTNGIQSLDADGFTVGTATQVNQNSTVYYYVAIKSGTNVYNGEYTGNNTDNRSITGVGFQPTHVFIKSEAAYVVAKRNDDPTGDKTHQGTTQFPSTDYIQSLDADGFTVGTGAAVNNSGSIMSVLAFQEATASTFVPKVSFIM